MRCLPDAGRNGEELLERHVFRAGAHSCLCGRAVRCSLVRRIPGSTDEVMVVPARLVVTPEQR